MHSVVNSNLLSISRNTSFPNVIRYAHHSCKILVIGGGTGGCTMAAKLSKTFHKSPNHVIIIEPSKDHYYQPLFTLIGGGISKFDTSKKLMKDVLPKNTQWLKDKVVSFEPEENKVKTENGDTVQYDVMIVAIGLELHWNKLPGLIESLQNPEAQVCSIYGPNTVANVFDKIKKTEEGNALFTFPNTPVKCPGAPQKIAYISEHYWTTNKTRNNINVVYNTSLPVIFGVKEYANSLLQVCNNRNIQVNLHTNLIAINPDKKEAVFQNLEKPENKHIAKYSLLHVTPPMGPPDILKKHETLSNEVGFLDIHPQTLQHNKFKNIYGIGDCTSTPNSKTMAAIASQSKVLYENIMANLSGREMKMFYNGYSSCPLVTAPGKCILAEFDYTFTPQETFPINQKRELLLMYLLKKHLFPFIYWNLMLKGLWNGPEKFRKIFTFIKSKNC
ncbi:PREDICTED: sulfide:quinone oxidoreductase, mitochondrial [Ceratosolen solmsi marchali]|uniref:Sulfide:quinone oxidoreductase, mitochondrial n=1 Tax=Ceratosolen solmsi marchali TaxID=326594 RepID=A0AAJ6YSI7_9HYME|nr:PREDICTED: sulfide:quinone oxidoreductase, mitochondrial [Ceratosolen solmsi marchali]